jgi:hypothetical protein
MERLMNGLSFVNGVLAALLASLLGSIAYFSLGFLFSSEWGMRLLISALAVAYCLYLLVGSTERSGRITLLLLYCGGLAAVWLFYLPLLGFAFWHVLAISVLRSLFFHNGVIAACADLALGMLGLAAAFWALLQSDSVFLSIWCFFLCQALFVYIPGRPCPHLPVNPDSAAEFNRAYQAAEEAVRKLSSQA